MYINPFVAGVISTVVVELIVIFLFAALSDTKKK